MTRTKTDSVDARGVCEYCRDLHPRPWTPPSPEVEQLQTLMRRVQALEEMIVQEKNRQETVSDALAEDVQAHIDFMEQQKAKLWETVKAHIDQHPNLKQARQLLDSIPGIGPDSAARMLAEIGDVSVFKSARQLAA